MSGIWKKARRFVFHSVLHADDSPHRIALGVAIATLVAFSPALGLQTVIALAIAAALRANKAVCIPLVWITNPFTAVPVYWFCWRLGAGLLDGNTDTNPQTVLERMSSVATVHSFSQLLEWSFWSTLVNMFIELGAELWLGCCIVGAVCGGLSYGLTRWGVSVYRQRRAARKMHRYAARKGGFLRPLPVRRRRPAIAVRGSA
ncbi:MAG: DUF2062 domain-containing protein [Planctomycetota bacterium]